ncbi:hypothetical protein FHX82_002614 [Amycolatopsis bartoniae]|nr:DUF6218 family protein [Amycolatopsis bartoniae]MBB2935560.1 hypothetical protein [Amycolatopsis bartoniae]TVT05255.1 hypothetical protein FNH07_23170 [Amycolatopsis bartoniae]
MTSAAETALPAPVELWAPGSAVVALGQGDGGEEAVAVWHVSPQGAPTGAWLVPAAEAFGEEETARRLLTSLERRGITGAVPGDVERILEQLSKAAGVDEWWREQLFSPVLAFEEVVARRAEIEKVVEDARATKNVAVVEWPADVTGYDVREFEDLRRVARLSRTTGEACGTAILVSRVLRWLVRQWAETEQVKNRRPYVRDALGEPQALPPTWLAAVQTGSVNVLPL